MAPATSGRAEPFGDRGVEWMAEAGVDLTPFARSETSATGGGFVMINRKGIPAIASGTGASGEFSPMDVDRAEPALAGGPMELRNPCIIANFPHRR